jgi:hypothetical protein
VSQAVFAKADADSDGFLTVAELAVVPGLKSAIDVLDTDGDKRLSSTEVSTWLQDLRDSRVARALAGILVSQKGKPVPDALVKLVPDPVMDGNLSEAEGRTDEVGYVSPRINGSDLAGASLGIYRVEITGKGVDGHPIPAKYNTETILGIAVGAIPPESYGVKFELE